MRLAPTHAALVNQGSLSSAAIAPSRPKAHWPDGSIGRRNKFTVS
jgi:hypothetical protein